MQTNFPQAKSDLSKLEKKVSRELERAMEDLENGLPTLEEPDVRPEIEGHKLVWHWQDRVTQVLEDYVTGLWSITERHRIESAWDWIEERVRNTFKLMLRNPRLAQLGLLRPLPVGPLEIEPQFLASRSTPPPPVGPLDIETEFLASRSTPPPPPIRTEWLTGELLIVHEGCQLRIPVTVSAQLPFWKIRALGIAEERVLQKVQTSRKALPGSTQPHWVFQKNNYGWSLVNQSTALMESPISTFTFHRP